jgi:hypothetical protein
MDGKMDEEKSFLSGDVFLNVEKCMHMHVSPHLHTSPIHPHHFFSLRGERRKVEEDSEWVGQA